MGRRRCRGPDTALSPVRGKAQSRSILPKQGRDQPKSILSKLRQIETFPPNQFWPKERKRLAKPQGDFDVGPPYPYVSNVGLPNPRDETGQPRSRKSLPDSKSTGRARKFVP
ncbi:hypothetical protein V6N13_018907 [Hibiscus sabdariffa]|uniref:Uncharacterized protein n=1 Tax=Hibiscus sabdariffa TaxID=183260 RepID=A0ABR2EKW9_9ROSI